MEYIALAGALVAAMFALRARAQAAAAAAGLDDVAADSRRRVENLTEEVRAALEQLRALVAELNDGAALTRDQILEGRLWRDVTSDEGKAMLEAGGVHVLDVRTQQEAAGGVLPAAQLIPIQELEQRLAEVPTDTRSMLIYCEGGGRSAAACEFLSARGYAGLHNLTGGFGSWSGPVERPSG